MPVERVLWVALAWVVFAVAWQALLPRDARGKTWHRLLAAAPLPGLAGAAWAPPDLAGPLGLWIAGGAGVATVVLLAWIAGALRRNHGLMDVAYPLAPLAALATMAAAAGRPVGGAPLVLIALVSAWSLRLAVQTWGHNRHAEREPYASWRRRFGPRWVWFSLFQVHALQGVMIWIWCAPFAFVLTAPGGLSPFAPAGAAVWLAGFLLQWTADRQLARFKANAANRGGLLDTGVWAWVRHPNYLGEAMMWAGWFVMALAHPWGWITVVAPLFNGWFMGFASAAPFKEHHMRRTRPDAWAAYCARTPMFLPWPRPAARKEAVS